MKEDKFSFTSLVFFAQRILLQMLLTAHENATLPAVASCLMHTAPSLMCVTVYTQLCLLSLVSLAYTAVFTDQNSCPVGLTHYTQNSTRICSTSISSGGCPSVNFPTFGVPFTNVCGRALGYQYGHTDAFNGGTIDSDYIEGLSVTHGTPRNHIWTFVAGCSKDIGNGCSNCPCASPYPGTAPPPFVRENIFCESGNNGPYESRWYLDDPLWDSQVCDLCYATLHTYYPFVKVLSVLKVYRVGHMHGFRGMCMAGMREGHSCT